ncbi:hypothetical protein EXIGLDRAFT_731583 [Exidia glandulosa HHB12029]|uniref:Auxin efflux carrier n=1 Tax=Exidia glandulosa HHB12029 TaxID=1314781 RepID=A0A165BTI1_EXIGL|nr:hypothetical protein EXIGLDRAFT_731583 [Exidia glandulosa HHB12029]
MSSEVGASLLGAVQGTLSVLVVFTAGFICARSGLLDKAAVRRIAKLCSTIFLPLLLVDQIGEDLSLSLLKAAWIVPVWGAVSTGVAHGIGWAAQRVFKLPAWTIVASGRPNATALPLMLLDALSKLGVLDALQRSGESRSEVLDRAKSLILLNVVVQQCITFMAGPEILAHDLPEGGNKRSSSSRLPTIQDTEHVGLLAEHDEDDSDDEESLRGRITEPLDTLDDTPNFPKFRLPRRLRWVSKVFGFLNPPLIGAIVAVLLSAIPPLHHVLYDSDGALNVPLLDPISKLGNIYVTLQMFAVGAELAVTSSSDRPNARSILIPLSVRFAIMPLLALGFVWATARRGVYGDDPLVWFLLILVPTGPSAVVLATLADTVGVDQGAVAGYLLIANLCAPLIAVTCAAALKLVEHLQ